MYDVLKNNNAFGKNDNDIWLASTLKLYRNIEGHMFPGKLDGKSLQQIVSLLGKAFADENLLKGGLFLGAEELAPLQKEYLYEHYMSAESFNRMNIGEGFVIDNTASFLATINMRNHLQMSLLDSTRDLGEALNRLVAIESAVGEKVKYAFTEKFGFLTADASQCGVGLKVYSYLHIPALINTGSFEGFCKREDNEDIIIEGIQGGLDKPLTGDIVKIHNKKNLGVTEENIISTIQRFVMKVEVAEKDVRTAVKKDDNAALKDKISRALGIMKHSCQMHTTETLSLLSLVKLGVALGWIEGIDNATINDALFCSRRAHLHRHYNGKIDVKDLDTKRAEYVHDILKPVIAT
ncbi:MAG: protein arginine kinase [Waddliaceae bacterium]|jgi:protein arginine kinase|nr:protein arginine kinase [Waddliaceae bacterium]MBT3579509.1 protein arginine kinase [Waddliaceae bacterium]MBT4444998.1 protein arginine kinase [Waddliaceae bacterium]MBT6928267.1 protein arginine kinase [Waddliaceae bacterium]MBT7264214.1 protein arginine kinase [Waddliaceae bacterium]